MAKKRRNWIEERDNIVSGARKLTNVEGSYEERVKARKSLNDNYKNDITPSNSKADKTTEFKGIINSVKNLPNVNQLQQTITASYNSLNATQQLAKNRADIEKALNNANKFKATYGADKNINEALSYLNNIKNLIDNETKGGSAATNMIIDRNNALAKGNIAGAQQAEAKGNILNAVNLSPKFDGKNYKDLKNTKTETPAEADYKEGVMLREHPLDLYKDNKKEIKKLKNKKYEATGWGGSGGSTEYDDDQARLEKLKEQNSIITSTLGPEIEKRLGNDYKALRNFNVADDKFTLDLTNEEKEKYLTDKDTRTEYSRATTKKILQDKYGLSSKEASILLDYEKNASKQENREAAAMAGERRGRLNSDLQNLVSSIGETVGYPVSKGLESIVGLDADYSHNYSRARNEAATKDKGTIGKGIYNMAETVGTIASAGLWGGAAFVPFAAKAADDSYYNAIDKGASEDEALNYATNSALTTGLIYSIGLKGINKITQAATNGGNGIVRSLAKEIVDGKASSSLGKAVLKDMAKTGVKQGADFAALTTSSQIADTLNQIATLGKNSDFELQKRQYMAQGMSESEAEDQVLQDTALSVGENALSSFAGGALMGAVTSGIGSMKSKNAYTDIANKRAEYEADFNKYTNDMKSEYFNDVKNTADLEEQYKARAKELHPDVEGGSEEAFTQLTADRERIEGILNGEYSEEAKQAIDKWENFVNYNREILGLDRVMTTKEKEQLDSQFSDAKNNLLEFKGKLEDIEPQTEQEAVEIKETIEKIDNEIAKAEDNVEATNDIVISESNLLPPVEAPVNVEPVKELPAPQSIENKNITVDDELNDRQVEIVEKGMKSDMSEDTLNKMLSYENTNISPTEYADAFSKMYVIGKDSNVKSFKNAVDVINKFDDTVIDNLTPEVAAIAYTAGKNDAPVNNIKTMLSRKPSGMFAADFEPKDENETLVNETLSNLAKFTGLDIILSDDLTKYKELKDIPKNTQGVAFTDAGRMALNRDTANILGVAMHESMHFAKNLSPEAYEEYAKIVSDVLREDLGVKGFDEQVRKIQNEYKEAGQNLSYDEALEEALAYATETLALNENALSKVVERVKESSITEAQKKNILDIIKEWIDRAIAAIKERISKASVRSGTEAVLKGEQKEATEALLKSFEAMRENLEKAEVSEEGSKAVKFSLSEPVEETKDLIAVHNLSPDELMQSIELGGIPMPSIAITKAKQGHTNFGSVSIILDKQFIDPKANRYNRVYGGDAWTPSFPSVEYKLNYDATRDLYDKTGFDTNSYDNLTPESIIEKMENKESVIDSFLDKEGVKIDDVLVDKKPKISAFKQKNVKKFIKDNNINIVKLIDNPELQEGLYSKIKQDAEQSDSNFLKITADRTINEIKSIIKEGYGDKHTFNTLERDLNIVLNPEQEKDSYATLDKKKEFIKENQKDYEKYLKNLIKDIFEDKYIIKSNEELFYPDGTRKSFDQLHRAYTLDNIVDEMLSQTEQGLADWFGGATTLRAAQEKTFDSIEDIKKNKDKIQKLTFEEVEKIRSDIDKELTEICDEISTEYDHDAIGESLLDAFRSKDLSKESLQSAFDWSRNNPKPIIITDKIAKRIQDFSEKLANIPRPYFEAKPRYAIRNEQLKKHALIVLPASAKKVINELDNQGFNYQTYDDSKGEEEATKERIALQNDNNLKFSLAPTQDSEGRELSKQQQEYFKDSKVRDRLGRLLEVYHGSPEGDFTVFLPGAFFTDDYFNADGYAAGEMVYAVYLNIEKPLEIDCKGAKWDNLDTPYGTSTQEIASNLDTSKYDGIIFRNINDSWIDDEEAGDSEDVYWTTNSNQIKSVTNTNPTTNEDIRKSLSQKEADDRIEHFREVHEDIGRQLKILNGPKLSNAKLKTMAQAFKRELGSKIDTYELTDQLNKLFTLVENKKGNINNTDVMDKAHQIVKDVMEQAKEVEPEVKQFIDDMRTKKIYMTDRDKAEITDYNYFRKSAFGKLRLVNSKDGALPVDEFFTELENYHPEVYDQIVGRGNNADAGNLIDLVDWINAAKDGSFSLYDMEGDSAVEHYALELLNNYAAAKVEDITNNKAKQRELYKNIGQMVEFAEEQQKELNKANYEAQSNKSQYLKDLQTKQSEIGVKLEEQKQDLQNSYNKTLNDEIAKVKDKYSERQAKAIAKLKTAQRERLKKWSEDRKRTDERQKVRRTRDRLKTTINKPTVKKYVPTPLHNAVSKLFNSIDLGEQWSIDRLNTMRDNAMIRYTGEELADKLAKIDAQEYKFVNELTEFKGFLDKLVNESTDDSDTYFAPVINMIDNTINKVGKKSLMNMSSDELRNVNQTLRAIEKATTERNRPQTFKLTDENGKQLETYEEAARLGLQQTKDADLIGKLSKALTSHMTGRNLMYAMGGFNPNSIMGQFADQLDRAYLKEAEIKQILGDIINPVIEEKEGKTNFTLKAEVAQRHKPKDLVDVGFKNRDGKPILLNHDNLIFEHLNLANDENLTHFARGGSTFPDYDKLYNRRASYGDKNKRTSNVDAEIRAIESKMETALENEDYNALRSLAAEKKNILEKRKSELREIRRNIGRSLTDYDRKVIKAWKEMLKVSTDMLNEYWNKTYGYEPFTVSNYWRIVTDPNFIKGSEGGNLQRAITNLSESGTTIARQEGAGNPLLSGSALFAIDDYINNTAKLIAYSGLQRDLNAVFKYTVPGYDNIQKTVEQSLPKVSEHFYTLQQDLFGGRQHTDGVGNRAIATMRGLSARSVLSPNLRVALAQIPSFLGTYRYTDGKALIRARLPKNKVTQDIINKYTPLMVARGASGFSLETADLKADTNKLLRGLNKVNRLAKGFIYDIPLKTDKWTVQNTFRAYLDYARRMYPNLEEGTPEQIANGESPLYKKAAELFNEGTMRTQPMFNTMNRNAWQRSDNEFAKTMTIFHTQPFQYFNLALQDIMNYKYENKKGNKAKAKRMKKTALKSIATILAANSLFVLIKQAVDKGPRHKKDELEAGEIAEQLLSSYANMFVLGSTMVDGIYSLLTKGSINDFEIYGTGVINSLYDLAEQTYKALDGKDVDIKRNVENVLGGLGIPASNIEKDFGGIWRNVEDLIDDQQWNYSNEADYGKQMSEEAKTGYEYAEGDITSKELNDYINGLKAPEDMDQEEYTKTETAKVKNKIKTTLQDEYVSGDITKSEAVKKLEDSGLFHSPNNYQSDTEYIQGLVTKWDIDSYKEAWVQTYGDSNGAKERKEMLEEIKKLPYDLAFPENPNVKPTYKSYKSSYDKLISYLSKWH